MKLVTVSQMRAIEKESDAKGISYAQLMENAGRGLAELIHALGQENGWDEVTGLVGSGNNGGDTLVALAWLAEAGWRTHAYLVNRKRDDALVERYLSAGGDLSESSLDESDETLSAFLNESDVFLDGLLGTGIKLPLKKDAAQVLSKIDLILSQAEIPAFIIAVDCPSGIDCDTGEAADETIPADLTVTMAAAKQGLLKLPAFEFVGDLQVVDIGLADHLDSWDAVHAEAADWDMVSALLPERTLASHKGTFGTAFVVAGSSSYTGAALLAGTAAYRAGVGLVTMAVPEPLHAALAGHLPEATWILLPHENGFISDHAADNVLQNLQVLPSPSSAAWAVLQNLDRATAFLLGPGLGDKLPTGKFVEDLISAIKIPMVIDADGLRHVSQIEDWHKKISTPAVLTPHPGEMSVLTKLSKDEIQSKREIVAQKFAKEWGHVVVLKGAFTVIAAPDGRTAVIPVATPALARAGTGDVLAGLIVGLRAQGVGAYEAAIAGAFIHAQSGLFAADQLGTTASVLAGDVLASISDVLAELASL